MLHPLQAHASERIYLFPYPHVYCALTCLQSSSMIIDSVTDYGLFIMYSVVKVPNKKRGQHKGSKDKSKIYSMILCAHSVIEAG